MRIRSNVLFQYTVITLVSITIFTIIMGYQIVRWSGDLQLSKHVEVYPQVITQKLMDAPELAQYIIDGDYMNHQDAMRNLAKDMFSLGSIVRVKIWDMNHTVVWSDDTNIIGKVMPQTEFYNLAIHGQSMFEITKPTGIEQAGESKYKEVLEIYVPVFYNNKVVGAFEIYEATDLIYADLQKNARTVWVISGIAGVALYLLLFGIFYRAYRKQIETNQNLLTTQEVTILALAAIAETRDQETGDHILRTQKYVEALARELSALPKYKKLLTPEHIMEMARSSPLHDIGKVAIADSILTKPGKLTTEEFEIMKTHPKHGHDALNVTVEKLGTTSFLETARELIYSHHEKWDGSGYPEGKEGNRIPLSGRIMALADVYDALRSRRVYKEEFSHEVSKKIIQESSGSHFDPEVVDAFLRIEALFEEISKNPDYILGA